MDEMIGRAFGPYRIDRKLGAGGIGAVYAATHQRTNKSYAVKVLLQDATFGDGAFDRFEREANALSALGHTNIVGIHDFNVEEDGTAYLVMDHLVGEDLGDRVERGPIPWDEAKTIFKDICGGLAAAHKTGILHRDLKPGNVFISKRDGERERAVLLDFGLAKITTESAQKLTMTGATMGTPLYMSPEQARADALDERTDIYSLGCILFEMLSGEPPFMGPTVSAILSKLLTEPPPLLSTRAPQISPALDQVLRSAMAKNPAERPRSVDAFFGAVQAATTDWKATQIDPKPNPGLAPARVQAMGTAATAASLPAATPATPAVKPLPNSASAVQPSSGSNTGLLVATILIGGVLAACVVSMILISQFSDSQDEQVVEAYGVDDPENLVEAAFEANGNAMDDINTIVPLFRKWRTLLGDDHTQYPPICAKAVDAEVARLRLGTYKESLTATDNFRKEQYCSIYETWKAPQGEALGLIRHSKEVISDSRQRLEKASGKIGSPQRQTLQHTFDKASKMMSKETFFPCFDPVFTDLAAITAEVGTPARGARNLLQHRDKVCNTIGATRLEAMRKAMDEMLLQQINTFQQLSTTLERFSN